MLSVGLVGEALVPYPSLCFSGKTWRTWNERAEGEKALRQPKGHTIQRKWGGGQEAGLKLSDFMLEEPPRVGDRRARAFHEQVDLSW